MRWPWTTNRQLREELATALERARHAEKRAELLTRDLIGAETQRDELMAHLKEGLDLMREMRRLAGWGDDTDLRDLPTKGVQ